MSIDHPVVARLEERRRDALVQYYLGQIVPDQATAAAQLITTEDLYQYQLLDNQVSAEVKTSWVAEAVASLQQYIHGIYNGMEPGHLDTYEREKIDFWRNWESRYAIWSANEMLQYYPENYIDPSLRIKKTEMFKSFEMEINQARINSDRVREAVLGYLGRFEEVSNLDVLTGYIDGATARDAEYYFVAREKQAPFRYFWRQARVFLEPANTKLNPTAWGEWSEIAAAFGDEVLQIRPVRSGGRLYVVWVEKRPREQDLSHESGNPVAPDKWNLDLKLTHLDLNGKWAVPMTITTLETDQAASCKLLAIAFESFAAEGATLALALQGDVSEETFTQARNAVFDVIDLTESQDKLLTDLLSNRYDKANRLQERFVDLASVYDGTQFEIQSIAPNRNPGSGWTPHDPAGGISRYLELSATCFTQGSGSQFSVRMNVRGKCSAYRPIARIDHLKLTLAVRFLLPLFNLQLVELAVHRNTTNPEGLSRASLLLTRYVTAITSAQLYYKSERLVDIDAWGSDQQKYVEFDLPRAIEDEILAMSATQLRAGAHFEIRVNGASSGPLLEDSQNHLSTYSPTCRAPTFRLSGVIDPDDDTETPLWSGPLTLNGGALSPTVAYSRAFSESDPNLYRHALVFGVGSQAGAVPVASGDCWFDVTLKEKPSLGPEIVGTAPANGGQFLKFNDPELQLKYVRLNSLFAQHLIQRASFSLDRLLHWDTQHLEEPGKPDKPTVPVPMDFDGANGRYLWELFFHLPHLVAYRLKLEMNYADAQDWLHYLFNPSALVIPAERAAPSYWQVRPLMEPGDIAHEVEGPTDPDAVAYSTPEHYQKTVYLDYVRNLIAWADSLYRQLTRDSLAEAKLLYVRALSLMGNSPQFKGISRWLPSTLESLARPDTAHLAHFENTLDTGVLVNLPARTGGPIWLGVLDSKAFRPPLNQDLLDLWSTLESRLSNLRHALTIDGKSMNLPLFEPMANPRDLMRAQAGGAGFGQRNPGGHFVVPPYRFVAILPRAQQAVETLIRFGEQVRQFMEMGDRAQQEELQQRYAIEMAAFAVQLNEENIGQVEATLAALQANKAVLELRRQYYDDLARENVSDAEFAAIGMSAESKVVQALAGGLSTAGGLASSAPNIFGMAGGGMQYGAPLYAASFVASMNSVLLQIGADNVDVSERYRRRHVEWVHMAQSAAKEIEAIDVQIAAQKIQIQAARTALEQQQRARGQADELYAFFTQTRSANVSLYRWLQGQMSTLYFQAYDAVTALCLSVQACWQYEIGDYDTRFIQPNVWFDSYHGLTAGEALKLGLLNMESAFVHRNERKLELAKTVSLKQLKEQEEGETGWVDALAALKKDGVIRFALTSIALDEDYPGLYLRQLLRVAVTIPAVVGPYQNIKARLLQVSSKTVIKADIAAVQYTHEPTHIEANALNVKFNLRPTGQIALSSGIEDTGMLQLNFDDGRYLPFEGTGADSEWELEFPRHQTKAQESLLETVTDIIIHFHYTAVDGGRKFAGDVEGLLKPEPPARGKTRARHAKKTPPKPPLDIDSDI